MNRQAQITTLLILIIIGLLSVVIVGSRSKNKNEPKTQKISDEVIATNDNAIIFFYGNTCPHCKDVEEWMDENEIEKKLTIVKKEVYDNKANSLELTQTAKSCGLLTNRIGVPFLYTPEKECLIGTYDIIDYLSQEVSIIEATGSAERSKK